MNNKSIFKWFSMLLLMMIVGMSGATAQSLVIDGFSIKAGETKNVAIQLATNRTPIYGVQTDIVLSEGLLLEAKASTVEGLSFVSNTVSSGAVRVSLLSIAGNTIPEGNVINLTVKASEAFTRGYIQLTNTRLTTSDTGDELKAADVTAAVTLDENGETEYEEVANGTIALEYSQSGFVENFGTLYTPDRMHVGFNDLAITNGSLLSFNGTKEFQGTDGSAISMATIINSSDVKLPLEVNDDNTLSLVWSLKEGYIFEPSKLSFEACRFGTDSGLLTASINCGNQQQVLCEAADVMRSGKGEITKFSFDIYNLVVTSSNSLCLNFSFLSLGMNKEMGLANIVIEGKLLKSKDVVTEPDPQTYTAIFDFTDPNFRENIGTAIADPNGYIYNDTFTAENATLQITSGSAPSRIYTDANRGQCLVTYKDYTTLTFKAPEGYAVTKIEFAAAGNSNIKNFTASSGAIEDMTWTGNAEGVRFLQGGTSYLANAIVTMAAKDGSTTALPAIEYKECANISAFNALNAGEYAKVTLTDAEVIGKSADGYSTVWIQDATGGCWIQYTSLNAQLKENTKLNGYVYVVARPNSGNVQMKEAEATLESKITATQISDYTIVEGTLAEVNVAANLNKVVKITGATLEETSATAGTLTQGDATITVSNGTVTANQQLYKIADWEKGKVLNNVTIIAILTGKSTTANQLLPISIVEEEAEFNTYTATFSTNRGWENVYAYAWSNEADGSVTEFFGEWPGMQIGAGDGVYTLSIEATAAPQYIIFNNGQGGEGNQTEDLAFENGKAYEFNVVVDDVLPIDIQFGPDYNQESIGSYTMTWTAVKDGHEWTLSGFNNNKNSWNYVKCGQKGNDQTATITSPVINAEVKSYIINVDNTRNVNSATLTILGSDGKTMEMNITDLFTTGEVVVPVDGQKGDSYVLTINSIAGANGTTQISKITLSDEDVTPTHIANTAETAYTVAKAIELVDAAQALSDTVYVKGIVSQVDPFNEQYDNITYWISDDGTTDAQQFECYRGKGLNGAGFTSANDVKVGATVIVKGTMQKYGYTYEFVAGNELVSYTAPENPFEITSREKPVPASQEFVEGQTYYLYNVGADMFFAAGNDYNTRASLAAEGQQVYLVYNEEKGYYELKNFVPKFSKFLSAFADGPESVWTDNDSRTTRFWNLQQEDDSYRISNADIEPDFFLGWNGNEGDTRLYLMDSQDANVSWKLVSLNDYEIYVYLLQVYNVAEQLKAKIEQAQEMGLDVAAEQAVYDNLSSTIDEMQECINALADRMANNASGTNPVDVTAKYIVNPSYDANDANGWSGTKPYSQRYQNAEFYNKTFDMYQDLSRLAPGVYKLGLQAYYRPGYIDNAYESWKSASNLFAEMYVEQFGEREIQPVMNTLDGSVTEKLGIGSEASVNDNGTLRYVPNDMQSANTYFNAGLYQNNLFFVVNETGDVRIGLSKYELIQSDWTMFDNWTLTYYGNDDDSYLAWVQTVAAAAPTFDGITVTQSVLNDYLAVCNAPVASNKAEAEAYVDHLNALKAAVQENSALWSQYENLVTEGQTLANQLKEEGKTNSQEYEDLNDYATGNFNPGEYGDEFAPNGSASYIINARAMDNATLEAEMVYLNELMDAAKYLDPQEGEDVTRYLVNPDFSEGKNGWTGWGSATNNKNMPTTGGSPNICAESYDANNFDLYQEVTGSVPVGVYEISVQGFTRIGRNDGYPKGMAWSQFRETGGNQKMPVYVYFNDNATNFKDIHEEPQTRDFYSDMTMGYNFATNLAYGGSSSDVDSLSNEWYYSQYEGEEMLYFPNTMTGASYAFDKKLYMNSAFGAVVNQGDPIRVGVKGSTNGANWSIYDNFKLTFWGLRADKVLLALQAGIADVEALNAGRVGKNVVERIANALAVAKNAAEEQSNDGEAMFATLGELYAAKSAVQASQELMDQLAAANDSLQDAVSAANLPSLLKSANAFRQDNATRLNNNDINDDEVPELLAQIRQWMYDISKFVELQEWTDRLNEAQPTDKELTDGSVTYSWLSEWENLAAELEIKLNPETTDEAVKVEEVDGLIEQIQQMIDTKYGEKVWTIAGYQDVLGSNWDPEDRSNDMVNLGNGIFQLEKKKVQLYANVGYEFKVMANHNWDENYGMYGEAGGENCYFYVDEDGLYNVTYIWNYESKDLYAVAELVTEVWDDTNYMYAFNGQVLQKGTTSQLSISMQNDESVVAFQFDVVLPDGMSLAYALNDDFEEVPVLKYTNRGLSSHVILAEYQNDGSLRIAGYSSKNAAYRYNDGELLNFGVYVSNWLADGNYTVTLKNVLITNADGVEKHANDRTFTVKVGGLKGDANNDGQVTMSDVVAIVNYVLGRANANFNFYNADVNGTGDVTMADVVGVVNIVLGRTVAGSRGVEAPSALIPGTLTLKAEGDRMSVKLDNTAAYTAFQMDVTLPEGMSLNDAAYAGRQSSSHSLLMSELENGKVRIAGWSANNAELKGNSGELLSLVLAGVQTVGAVTIDNIRFVTADGVEHAFAAVEAFGETTGIGLTPALSEGEGVVYDLQGRKVNRKTLKGLYILDGKKSVKK